MSFLRKLRRLNYNTKDQTNTYPNISERPKDMTACPLPLASPKADSWVIYHLAETFDAFEHAQEEDGPGGEEAERQRPPERPQVVDAVRQLQHVVAAATAGAERH